MTREVLGTIWSMFLGGVLAQIVLYPFGIFHPEIFFGILIGQITGLLYAKKYFVPYT